MRIRGLEVHVKLLTLAKFPDKSVSSEGDSPGGVALTDKAFQEYHRMHIGQEEGNDRRGSAGIHY